MFIYLAYFVYSNYLKNILNKNHVLNKELVNNPDDLENNDSLIVFFKTEWCKKIEQQGHSKKFVVVSRISKVQY